MKSDNQDIIPKIIFIIPYRNRLFLKIHFEKYMQYILEDLPKDSYKIYFAHQKDSRPFNRGATKNIGFIAMRELYPNDYKNITFVFNDIDTTPAEKNFLNFETTLGVVKHFYGFTFALGGIFSIKGSDFEKINGFPNYWAWGLEDNDIKGRADRNKLVIDRSQFCKIADARIIHIPYDYRRIISKQQSWRAGPECIEGLNDIKTLNYIINNEYIDITNFTTLVDPSQDNYVYTGLTGKIPWDKNFIPPDAVRSQPPSLGGRKNKPTGQHNINNSSPSIQNKLNRFSLF
jgi:hypothetical protein